MVYFILVSFDLKTLLKRFGISLLLFLCISLIGCESRSSITTDSSISQSSTDNQSSNNDVSKSIKVNNSEDASDKTNDENEGESLIAAARPADDTQKSRSPMVAAHHPGSALQATLIGDYVGMLPCSFCDGTAITLNLFADGSVVKTSVYKNPDSPKAPLVESGIYRQDDKLITIVYNEKSIENYQVQDNHLVMMSDGSPKVDYTLSRQ